MASSVAHPRISLPFYAGEKNLSMDAISDSRKGAKGIRIILPHAVPAAL